MVPLGPWVGNDEALINIYIMVTIFSAQIPDSIYYAVLLGGLAPHI